MPIPNLWPAFKALFVLAVVGLILGIVAIVAFVWWLITFLPHHVRFF